jgi:hypothetical protein
MKLGNCKTKRFYLKNKEKIATPCITNSHTNHKHQKNRVLQKSYSKSKSRQLRSSSTHQYGIADEEDGSVVARQVPVALLRVELDGKSTRIARSIGRALFATCTSFKYVTIQSTQPNVLMHIKKTNAAFHYIEVTYRQWRSEETAASSCRRAQTISPSCTL